MIFTSESVTEGHPDKICDQISDAILDECLKQDKNSKVAAEAAVKNGTIWVFGEITTKGYVDVDKIVRKTLKNIGYDSTKYGIDYENCGVLSSIVPQSPDISKGVEKEDQGAGDQGMMFGYACRDTREYMPLPIMLAHKITKRLTEVRKEGEVSYLGPDGKAQVSVEDGKVCTVVVSNQHDKDVSLERLRKDVFEHVIKPVCGDKIDENTVLHINPTGRFVIGGPRADAGLTGRKIIVDTYGGIGRHGGGAFSGKDPSKVDRSAAYMARYIAKNIVAAGLAEKFEVQIAYAIGVSEPVSISLDTFGTGKVKEEEIVEMIRELFPLRPREIIKYLDLKRPIYRETARNGHFGGKGFPWERVDKVDEIRKLFK